MQELSRREVEILLSIWDLKDEAYLVGIRKRINSSEGKNLTIGAIHIPLINLEKEGLIESNYGESTPIRGGRKKKIYRLTQLGIQTLKEQKKELDTRWASFSKAFS